MLAGRRHAHWAVLLAAVLVGGVLGAVAQPSASTPVAGSPSNAGAPLLTYPLQDRPAPFALAPDGQTLYVQQSGNTLNVWRVIFFYWPEWLGGVMALLALVTLLSMFRIKRRQRLIGEPYCRRCNYCLKGCPSDRCPECGAPTRRPVIGRSVRRRLVAALVPLVVALTAYGSMLATLRRPLFSWKRLPWQIGFYSSRPTFGGPTWLLFYESIDRIVAVDVHTGAERVVMTRWIGRPGLADVTPDGRYLIIVENDKLQLIDVTTGRPRWARERELIAYRSGAHLAGIDDDGRRAYVVSLDEAAHRTKLVAWDLQTGTAETLLDAPVDQTQLGAGGPTNEHSRRLFQIPGPGAARFVELPNELSLSDITECRVRVAGDAGTPAVTFQIPGRRVARPVFTSDGRRAYFLTDGLIAEMRGFDLTTGSAVPSILQPGLRAFSPPYAGPVADARGDRMVASLWLCFRVYDLEAGKWLEAYEHGCEILCDDLRISADGRYFAARNFRELNGIPRREIWVYPLQSADAAPSPQPQSP